MRRVIVGMPFLIAVVAIGIAKYGLSQNPVPAPNPDAFYKLGPDSLEQEGVPKGQIRGPFTLPSTAYPGTQHTYWVYVPAQYNAAVRRESHDLQRWPGVYGAEWQSPGPQRSRQSDLPARDSCHDRESSLIPDAVPISRNRHRRTGATAIPIDPRNTTRWTIAIRALSSMN